MIMNDKLNNFYIKCIIRTLKEFNIYNSNSINALLSFIKNEDYFCMAPHVMGENFFSYNVKFQKKYMLRKYYVSLISKRFIKDLKSYLKANNKENKFVTDNMILEKLEAFQIFSFLYNNFHIGEPDKEDYLTYFYNG